MKREYLKYQCCLLSKYQKNSIKTFNSKPSITHIIIDIRTKKTLDSLKAKNRTNIARRPAKVKPLDPLEAKNRANIIARRPAKAKLFKLNDVSTPIPDQNSTTVSIRGGVGASASAACILSGQVSTVVSKDKKLLTELLQLSLSRLHNS